MRRSVNYLKVLPSRLSSALALRRSTRRWFLALLILLIFLTFSYVVAGFFLIRNYRRSVVDMHISANELTRQNADQILRHIQEFAVAASSGREVTRLAAAPQWDENLRRSAYLFSDQLNTGVLTSDSTSDIYVYFPHSDMVIGSLGVCPAGSYYDLLCLPEHSRKRDWLNALRSADSGLQLLPHAGRDKFCYLWRSQRGDAPTAVVVEIDVPRLIRALEASHSETALYYNGRLIAHEHKPGEHYRWPERLNKEDYPDRQEVCRESPARILISHPSSFPDLLYLRQYRSRELYTPIQTATAVIGGTLLLTLTLGLGWSVYISRRNNRPWNELLKMLGSENSQDDYAFAQARIHEVLAKYKDSSSDLQKQQNLLNTLFLKRLLHMGRFSEAELFALAREYKVNFTGDRFVLLSFRCLTCEDEILAAARREFERHPEIEAYLAFDGSSLRLLVNYENPEIPALLKDRALNLPAALADKLKFLSISEPCENISELFILPSSDEAEQSINSFPNPFRPEGADRPAPPPAAGPEQPEPAEPAEAKPLPARPQAAPANDKPTAETAPAAPQDSSVQAALPTAVSAAANEEAAGAEQTEQPARCAKNYIDENFRNPLLGLYLIAEHVGLSNSYISSLFKQTYGVGITTYINQKRIELAKELILNSDLSIKEIAEIVGFSSDMNFIRVFKRCENSTPGSFRKKNN